ncbi:MAG TPA: 1-deoxy-D-xylulose-5-phosphate synthase [Motilibacteraceae bacterium]|nr:1-deoxy-D-xylulose-5-phosphate synthase [Motilibacteraceae bacterium]
MADDGPGAPRLLSSIGGPADVRALAVDQLPRLASEVRELLVAAVSEHGGHLGSNLGVVELSIALHRAFDSPRDAIVWDTGHQAYVHKLLTGRHAGFATLREPGGLSGYPSRAESEHDWVENSHASTALSYADGLAKAVALQDRGGAAASGPRRHVVAVVGDGSLTGGMAWEALNNLGAAPDRPVVVVLNDNGRSYAPTVGAVAEHLATLRDPVRDTPGQAGSTVFEQLGFAYLGPVDGHDVEAVEAALSRARDLGRPVVVHVWTVKGKGHLPAETDPADCLHAVSPRPAGPRPATAQVGRRPSWTEVVADELARIGDERPDVAAVTAAMLRPTGLHPLAREHPDRVFDVGIAEQHAVASAAGMALGGLHPVVCVYATFLNRAVDQVLLDVAMHRLPVTFVLDRAGVTGSDGPSHHGMWDISLLGVVPGLRLAAPRDEASLRELLGEAVAVADGPTALRFPKGSVPRPVPALRRVGTLDVLHEAGVARGGLSDVLLLPAGPLAGAALEAADELARAGASVTVADPRWLLPVDAALVELAARHRVVVTAEDGGVAGGFGDAVGRALREAHVPAELRTLGLPQRFLAHGSREAILAEHGLDCAGILAAARQALGADRPVRALG